MVNVKKRKGRVVIDSDSEDSASDDNLDQVGATFYCCYKSSLVAMSTLSDEANVCYLRRAWPRLNNLKVGP